MKNASSASPPPSPAPLLEPTAPARADSPRILGIILFSRIALNLQFRVVYPFLPAISRGLGVPLETASLLLTVRALVSMASPLYGALADRFGRRALMLVGLVALIIGTLLIAIAPGWGVALIAFVILGFSKSSYDPAMQAYLGDAVPYERRGSRVGDHRAGLVSFLVYRRAWNRLPDRGRGLARAVLGHRSAGGARAARHLAAVPGMRCADSTASRGRPSRKSECRKGGKSGKPANRPKLRPIRPVWATPKVFAMLAVPMLMTLANENVAIIYGAWLETAFKLTVASLGVASVVISVAELVGEGLTVWLVDRLGKHRTTLTGLVLGMAAISDLSLVSR